MKKPSSKNAPSKRLQPRKSSYNRVVEFPQARGRTVERVKLFVSDGYNCVAIEFEDKTDLSVVIDPGLRFKAEYSDWKTGNQRVLKRWPLVRSEGM
jgi:hypothetical protein